MANHLTPEELSKELGIDREQIIKVCLQESVPIYHAGWWRSTPIVWITETGPQTGVSFSPLYRRASGHLDGGEALA